MTHKRRTVEENVCTVGSSKRQLVLVKKLKYIFLNSVDTVCCHVCGINETKIPQG